METNYIKRLKNIIKRTFSDKYKKVLYRPLNKPLRKNKVNPWAFIRVKNEIKTIEASLNSILPAIKKGVIGYNPSTDGTEEFILDFCKQNTGFIPFKYDYDIIPPNHLKYTKPHKKEERLDTYYNAVLSNIPIGEWLIKIDCDQIYDSKKLEQMLYLPKYDNDCVIISRLDMDFQDGKLYIYKDYPFTEGWDHWLLKRTNKTFFTLKIGKGNHPMFNNNIFAYENLDISDLRVIKTDLITWHFPLLKKRRKDIKVDLVPFHKHPTILNLKKSHISTDMVDEERILRKVNKFNL